MDELNQEEMLREAELYEEMKDLAKLREIFGMKMQIFELRNFKLRSLVLENLKNLTKMQLKALDEEYNLIGLDSECWKDEEHFLHQLEEKIGKSAGKAESEDIKKAIDIENKEEKKIKLLTSIVKQYITLLYNELKTMDLENLLEVKSSFLNEEKKIKEIERMITLEENEEEDVARSSLSD